jgi:hypothetical protein
VDAGGTKAGFPGPRCYIDSALFNKVIPSWIKCGPLIDWAARGMTGQFFQLVSLDHEKAGKQNHVGINCALEIANSITGSPDAAKKILRRNVDKILVEKPPVK